MQRPMVHRMARPGELDDAEIRALWELRLSLISLRPDIDPEQDFAAFRSFLRQAHVGRVLGRDGRPSAMLCHKRIDGEFRGRRYRVVIPEYGAAIPSIRRHWSISLGFVQQLVLSRRLGATNYVAGAGYPRSIASLARLVPDLRVDGDPSLDELERHLVDRVLEHVAGRVDERRIIQLRTIPDPVSERWRRRTANNPTIEAYEARAPDWAQGKVPLVIGRLDGSARALIQAALSRAAGR